MSALAAGDAGKAAGDAGAAGGSPDCGVSSDGGAPGLGGLRAAQPSPDVPLGSLLECAICLGLVVEPITVSCGHSFCRLCLVKTLSRTRKRCPSCRAVCHNCAEDQPENVMLAQIARAAFPQLYAERVTEAVVEKSSMRAIHPIFFYNVPLFPGKVLSLHLFEPRYRLMMRRIINTTRRFAYVPNYTNYEASVGDVALIAEVKDCEFQADGCCYLTANLTARARITDHYTEDGTHGLHFAQLENFADDIMTPEEQEQVDVLAQPIADFVKTVLQPIAGEVVKTHGAMPPHTQPQAFSLYIAGVLPLGNSDKHAMLAGSSTLERLRACARGLSRMGIDHPHRHALVRALEGGLAAAAAAAPGSTTVPSESQDDSNMPGPSNTPGSSAANPPGPGPTDSSHPTTDC